MKKVFSNWKYSLLGIVIGFLFYTLNVLTHNWNNLRGFSSNNGFFSSLNFFYALFVGFGHTVQVSSFVSLIVISLFFGVLVSLIVYKTNFGKIKTNKKAGVIASVGIFLAALVPGCTACGVGLISVFGIGAGFLNFLPYKGYEISLLSILILGYAIEKTSENMFTCKVKMKGGKINGA